MREGSLASLRTWTAAPAALALVLALPGLVQAADGDDAPRSVVLEAQLAGDNPFQPGSAEPFPARIYLQGERSRIDLTGPAGERVMLLRDGSTGIAWLVSLDEGAAMPSDARGLGQLFVDPVEPCAHLRVRCVPAGSRFIAGEPAEGWKYRDARGRGPGGTSDGTLWVRPGEGLVVGYTGTRTDRGDRFSMDVHAVWSGPLPQALFEPPESTGFPDDTPERKLHD